MKKFISFLLAAVLLVSAVPTALATNDYSQGTQVVYTANGSESYTITVPALLAPGNSGTVTLSGTWADNRIVTVTADPTVTLKNSIKETDTKTLNVNFAGISEAGSNTGSQTFTESVSVDNITNALFGTWSGKFNYNVDMKDTNQNGSPVKFGIKYVRTYLKAGVDASNLPMSITAYEDGSFLYVMDSGTEYNIPAGTITINGNIVDTGDEKELMVISDDGSTVTLSDASSKTVLAIWTLASDIESPFPVSWSTLEASQNTAVINNIPFDNTRWVKVSDATPSVAAFVDTYITVSTVDFIFEYSNITDLGGYYFVGYFSNDTEFEVVPMLFVPEAGDFEGVVFEEPGIYAADLYTHEALDATITIVEK